MTRHSVFVIEINISSSDIGLAKNEFLKTKSPQICPRETYRMCYIRKQRKQKKKRILTSSKIVKDFTNL